MVKKKRILYLPIKKKWFDLIVVRKKRTDYRAITDYWTRRLLDTPFDARVYDEVHFRNGYLKKCPFMRVEWLGTEKEKFEGILSYAIRLGKILEIKNLK